MSTKSRQLDELVRGLRTVADEDLVAETRSPLAEALFVRIVAEQEREARATVRRSRRLRWWLAAAGLATAGAVFAIAIGLGQSPEAVTPAAAALRQVAGAARAQEAIPPGQYLYVRSDNASLAFGTVPVDPSDVEGPTIECCEALVPYVRELWLGDSAGDARLRERRAGELQFVSEEERERWIELGRPKLDAKTPFSGILVGLPRSWYEGPLDLPSDAEAIYEEFERDAEIDQNAPGAPVDVDVSGSMFLHFSDVLREARASPEQRASAYEALARVPGLVLLDDVTDRLGRPGVAIALDVVDNEPSGFLYRHVLVFDPQTSNLLEERREVLPGNRYRGLSAGLTEAYATYEYAVVGSLGERPSGE